MVSSPQLKKTKVAIIGGGPSALFVFKKFFEAGRTDFEIHIFERKQRLGLGMPYGDEGANPEHITNVSGNELPDLVEPLADWVRALPEKTRLRFGIDGDRFTQEKVLPRLLFGMYMESQFQSLLTAAEEKGLATFVHLDTTVSDLRDLNSEGQMEVVVSEGSPIVFDRVIVCSGHNWPKGKEEKVPGFYASPYPPAKISKLFNHPVALRGSSLTAVDAIRTLALNNGGFVRKGAHLLEFVALPEAQDFKIVMHTRNGLLPCVRIHLDEPEVSDEGLLPRREWEAARREHDGFVPLDLIFEEDFKKLLAEKDPELFEQIRDKTLEEFVDLAMTPREDAPPFHLFKKEYAESLRSLSKRESIPWKEVLAILSYALNYPAKHFSAEDMLRLQTVLMPLISVVIAFLPQESCEELIALHDAGRLELVAVGEDSKIEVTPEQEIVYRYTDEGGVECSTRYETYIDCVGQPHLSVQDFPFPTLIEQGVVCRARLRFRSLEKAREQMAKDPESVEQDSDGTYHLLVPGIAINDAYQPVSAEGRANPSLHIMAVPYIGGHNPDYSGVDFCEESSSLVVESISRFESVAV